MRKNQKADGTYPLVIRITKNKKTSYIGLEYHILEKDWDAVAQRVKKSHPNSGRMNQFINKKLFEATNTALEMETEKDHVSSATVRQRIKPQAGSTFIPQAELYLDRLKKDGKFNQHSASKPRLKHFKEYVKGDISFQDITPSLLNRFKADIKTQYKMSERTAVNHLVFIRSVFSQAIGEKVCDKKYYPFGKEGVKIKFPDTKKIGLTHEEVKKIEDLDLSNSRHDHARDIWLLSFYFAGMRISDVLRLKWSDFQDGRLIYIMGKNDKGDSLKIPDKAAKILDKQKLLKSQSNDLVFRDLDVVPDWDDTFDLNRHIASRTNSIDSSLKAIKEAAEITKPLSMHISRHTFGNISGEKISIKVLQKLYRHASPVTTAGYQSNFVHKEADEALDAVLGG